MVGSFDFLPDFKSMADVMSEIGRKELKIPLNFVCHENMKSLKAF